MMQIAELAQRIVVLHRSLGYLHLELPPEICGETAVDAIEAGMKTLDGLSSAAVDRGWKRISIRFDAQILSTPEVARHLFSLLPGLPLDEAPAAEPEAAPSIDLNNGFQPLLDKLKAIIIPAAPPPEGSLQARFQPMVESALTEKAITNFFNDIVAFYLIRVHWDLITKRWLQNPVANSNAWLTVFYLVFLLVRYRKTK
ncbi:hypothetical protein KI614_09315 [Dechloromonas denitrificans]|uniref:hypothetical protein n=1 Tax=Dechloromonas denitrificans TaxID=281362 RepID=UPI001CF905E7|nr:hypothetical protein [Dechloromonas denitrificans]UCV10407.1 hypothetical protein KI614_09315 [Dechloromonas denitrificans]